MALLAAPRGSAKWLARALALAMVASGVGCMLLNPSGGGEQKLAFSHERHVGREGLDCVSCHENYAMSDEPGLPELETCQSCHETLDEGKPADRQIASLFADGKFKASHAAKLGEERVFSHKLHAGGPLACADCHRGIESNTRITAAIGVPMQRCVECHAERNVKSTCDTCHREIRETWPPPSHHQNWKQRHGQLVRSGSAATADKCSTCHSETLCITCHKDEPPLSHTNYFRLRGHGITAMMDRQNCAACHEPESCERCHQETLPASHTIRWGSPRDQHCGVCHFPLRGEACIVCHKDTTSHSLAPPKPPWHTPAMNCRQCHGVSEPLPHFDNGDDCNICHM